MPNVDGEYTPFAYRISVGAENIDNTGSANVSIPTAPTVNTNSTQLYFFEIENPAQYDSNNQSDSPADHSDTNYSADFAIQAPRILEKKGPTLSKSAIAGIAVGGAVCLFLAGFAFWCRLNREKLRNAEETADVSYRPDKSMFQTRTSELPRTPTTPPKRISFSDSSSGSPTTLEASPTSMAEILDEDPSHGVRILILWLPSSGHSLPNFLAAVPLLGAQSQ